MAELIVTYPDGRVQHYDLGDEARDVGREPDCHIQIDDATVSRRHADICGGQDLRFTVRDLGSKNGTYVNNTRITARMLHHGDEIIFGSVRARFESTPTDATSVMIQDPPSTGTESVSFAGRHSKLQLSEKRLQRLYEVAGRLTRLRDRQDLLTDVMNICIEIFEFERGAIAIKTPDGRGVEWPEVHRLRGMDGEIRISRTILRQALEDGQRAVFSDSDQNTTDPTMSIVQQGTRSAMCVPLAYADQILGVIYGDRTSTVKRYEQEDVDFLAGLAELVTIGLVNSRLLEEQERKRFLEGEIAIARQIQSGLFPETLELHDRVEMAATNEPGQQVSGDYYDIVPMKDNRVGIIVSDVSGKGVASALLAANLQAAVRVLLPENDDLSDLCNRINRLVYHNTDTSRFITGIVAVIDPQACKMSYVSAGHNHPVMIAADEPVKTLEGTNHLPFGILEDEQYKVDIVDLQSKDGMFLYYTDGLHEAMNDEEHEYGTDRIVSLLEANRAATPDQLLKAVRADLNEYCGKIPQHDDVTLVAARTLIHT